ncbi:Histone-lysine N-methyltransferase ASHH3 [Bienertia sinuspersici]
MFKKSADDFGIENVFNKMMKQLGNPVEFELPEWLNRWQSDSYVFIKRNIYVTKKPKRRYEDDGIFCSCGQYPGSNASCGSDCHCGMLLSTCSSNCKCRNDCVNKPFQQRPVKRMKLVQGGRGRQPCFAGVKAGWAGLVSTWIRGGGWSGKVGWQGNGDGKGRKTEKCGSGIVADEDIKQGEFVIEYVGEGAYLCLYCCVTILFLFFKFLCSLY